MESCVGSLLPPLLLGVGLRSPGFAGAGVDQHIGKRIQNIAGRVFCETQLKLRFHRMNGDDLRGVARSENRRA